MRRYQFDDIGEIKFVASVSQVNHSQLTDIVNDLKKHNLVEYALGRMMFCPLTCPENVVDYLKSLSSDYDLTVSCDSGGYESQVNDEYSMKDIYTYDRNYYSSTDWHDELVLPDQVPIEGDDKTTIEQKVQDTISLSRMLYNELPNDRQERAVPVIQGHTKQQIVECLDVYRKFDKINKIGFGSFGTGGVNGGVNYLNEANLELLQFAVKEARKYNLDVHAFGIGGPTSIPILYQCGVDTFDSTGWIRSAGYGNIFFPFKSRFNVTHLRNRSGPTVFRNELKELKEETGHECPFCQSFESLQDSRQHRVLHNLMVMREMTDMMLEYSLGEIIDIMNPESRYTGYLKEFVSNTSIQR